MLRVDNSPRVVLKDEHRSNTTPKALKKRLEWNIVSDLWKFVYFFEGTIELLLVLLGVNFLRFFKGIEVM